MLFTLCELLYILTWKSISITWVIRTKSVGTCFVWGCDGCYVCACELVGDIVYVVCSK